MSIKDLMSIIPDLTNLFLSGFIFMRVYGWLNNKKIDITIFTIMSLFISILIKSLYATLHIFILPGVDIHESVKVIIYSSTGFILAILCTQLLKINLFRKLFYKINNKSINDDIFDEMIDNDKRTMMNIFLKSSDTYYIGRFYFREQKEAESRIALVDYYRMDQNDLTPKFDPDCSGIGSSVIINLQDIEIFYEKASKVWERISNINH